MRYSASHEWIAVNNEHGVVGVSSFAQKELGDIVFIELPRPGQLIKAGEAVAVLESTKAASDIYTPVSGTVLEVNPQLKEDPGLINRSPLNDGWLFKLQLSDTKELEKLWDENTYLKQIGMA